LHIEVEHFHECREHGGKGSSGQRTEPLPQSLAVDCSELIQCDTPILAAEPAARTKRIIVPGGRHWRNNHCPKVMIELVRGYDYARPRFADLTSPGRIELYQVHLAATWDARRAG
jgi:hypothetical protein